MHVWSEDGGHFWGDAEDHGGFGRNVPAGPLPTHDMAAADAGAVIGDGVEIDGGRPPRYDDEGPSALFRP